MFLDSYPPRRPGLLSRIATTAVILAVGWVFWRWWAGPPVPETLTARIDAIVDSAMSTGSIAGMSVAVGRNGRVVHARGYGFADLEHEVPATEETVYNVGSITKQFTAAAVMTLVEEELLSLDTPISRFASLTHDQGMTIGQLLSHTAGVADYTTMDAWWRTIGREVSPEELVRFFQDAPTTFPPGSRFSYSNSGYVLLGYALEEITSRPYGGYLNARLLSPAGLNDTRYCDHHTIVPNRARGYRIEGGGYANARYLSQSQAYAAGALCSTALDLLRWGRALGRGTVLDESSYEQMTTPASLSDGSTIEYGFGLALGYLDGRRRISHVGGTLGYSSQLAYYEDDDVTVVVLTNTERANAAAIETRIARAVLGLGEATSEEVFVPAEELERYEGTYDLGLTRVDVVVVDGGLEARVSTPGLEGTYRLLHQGDGRFQAQEDPEVVVVFDAEGASPRAVVSHRGITLSGNRTSDAPPSAPGSDSPGA